VGKKERSQKGVGRAESEKKARRDWKPQAPASRTVSNNHRSKDLSQPNKKTGLKKKKLLNFKVNGTTQGGSASGERQA